MDSNMESAAQSGMETASRKGRCSQGFSLLQIAILSVLKACSSVIAYWQIAEQVRTAYGLQITEGAVRGAMDRLIPRGFLVRIRAVNGRIQGNRYVFSPFPCPHIRSYPSSRMESCMDSDMEPAMHSGENASPSILKEENSDRENLSISSEKTERLENARKLEVLTECDIAFHWPELARLGFGTHQIRQIVQRLAQVGIASTQVMQGLIHAEWELAAGRMRDGTGTPVANPVNWIFSILARQGYYRRPEGYVSPEEQAAHDAAKEAEQVAAAHTALFTAECSAWIATLSEENRQFILSERKGQFPMPPEVLLTQHFRSTIWPKIQGGSTAKTAKTEEG
jgi:hypothetical protein